MTLGSPCVAGRRRGADLIRGNETIFVFLVEMRYSTISRPKASAQAFTSRSLSTRSRCTSTRGMGRYPEAERAADKVISLPMSAETTDEGIAYVVHAVREAIQWSTGGTW